MFMKRKLKSDRGFTLAELLIVVAIIGVLVAIAIPIFTSQLERSREAVDLSDVRSAYAEVMMAAITGDTSATYTKDSGQKIYKETDGTYSIMVTPLKQQKDDWQTPLPITIGGVSSSASEPYWVGVPGAGGSCKITYHPPGGGNDEFVSFYWKKVENGTNEQPITPGNGTDNNVTIIKDPNSDSINTLITSANKIPEQAQSFSVTAGCVYSYKDKTYVALNTQNILNGNEYWVPGHSNAGYLYVEIKKDTPIRTSANLEKINEWATKKTVLKNLKAGSLYKDDLGNIYIYKYDSQGDTNIPPPQGTWLWQIITVS